MEIKIIKIYEENNILRVITECEFGQDNLGLNLNAKYKDIDGEYKWIKEVKELLNKKYNKKRENLFKEFCNKKI